MTDDDDRPEPHRDLAVGLCDRSSRAATIRDGVDGGPTVCGAVVLDVMLPGIDGLETVLRVRAQGSRHRF